MSPAVSKAQQRLFAIAAHNPSALHPRNRALATLPKTTLRAFAATSVRRLPTRVKS